MQTTLLSINQKRSTFNKIFWLSAEHLLDKFKVQTKLLLILRKKLRPASKNRLKMQKFSSAEVEAKVGPFMLKQWWLSLTVRLF